MVDGKNRLETRFVARETEGRRWLMMRSKVSNRNGAFVDFERVTGAAEISFAPFVSNRNASRTTDFDGFEEPRVWEAASEVTAVFRESEWKRVMGACEAP